MRRGLHHPGRLSDGQAELLSAFQIRPQAFGIAQVDMFYLGRLTIGIDVQQDANTSRHGTGHRDFLSAQQGNMVHTHCSSGFGWKGRTDVRRCCEHSGNHVIKISDLIAAENCFHQLSSGTAYLFRLVLIDRNGPSDSPNCHLLLHLPRTDRVTVSGILMSGTLLASKKFSRIRDRETSSLKQSDHDEMRGSRPDEASGR